MPVQKRQVTGGVDTHAQTHHAAVIDQVGRELGDQEFPATASGYRALLRWLRSFGRVVKVGVEGTGSYGAGLARHLHAAKVTVVEVDRPDRKTRRRQGKSDPIDAVAAARAALSGTAAGKPKTRGGPVEAIRALRVARNGAIKARTAALNQLYGLLASAPEETRAELAVVPKTKRVSWCAELNVATVASLTRSTPPRRPSGASLDAPGTSRLRSSTSTSDSPRSSLRPPRALPPCSG
jgi:transposase